MVANLHLPIKHVGGVLFASTDAPDLSQLARLAENGITVRPTDAPDPGTRCWSLSHPTWGDAQAMTFGADGLPPMHMIGYDPALTSDEKEAAKSARSAIALNCDPEEHYVLRDRKNMLRLLSLLLKGGNGLMAVDHASEQFWSEDALDDELAHDADLDIQAMFSFHAVQLEGSDADPKIGWLHTHGLNRIGAVDFDLIRPSDHAVGDALRAIALAIVERTLVPDGEPRIIGQPNGIVSLVSAATFDRLASRQDRALREPDAEHTDDRVVVCDPPKKSLLGKTKLRPSTFFRRLDDGCVFGFSGEASEMMAERARRTFGVLRDMLHTYEALPKSPLVKIGYDTASGSIEHLWFEVKTVGSDHVEAELINDPFDVPALKKGEVRSHGIERMSDWTVMTPIGTVSPRETRPLRILRAHADEIIASFNEQGMSP